MHNFLFLNRINNETKLLSRAYISTTYLMYIFPCHNACNNNRLSKVIIYTATTSTPCQTHFRKSREWQHCDGESVGVSFVNFRWRRLATLPPPPFPLPCLSLLLSPLLFFSLFSIFFFIPFPLFFFLYLSFCFHYLIPFLFNKRQIFSYLRIEV